MRPGIGQRPSWPARQQLFSMAGVLSSVKDAAGHGSLEAQVAEWFMARARHGFLVATWVDDARWPDDDEEWVSVAEPVMAVGAERVRVVLEAVS